MTNGIVAGNTVETLTATPVEVAAKSNLSSAADPVDVEREKQTAAQTAADEEDELEVEFEPESVFVTREEFDELLARIAKYNLGASHKI